MSRVLDNTDHLELVSLQTKEVLSELNSPVRYLYFPINSAISLMDLKAGGDAVEVAVVGREGCTGFTVVQGYRASPCRVVVQVGGSAFRLSARILVRTLSQLPFLGFALTRLSTIILRAAIISVGCSQFHSVEQRIGRWLLAQQHRTGRSLFPFTHDFLAEQLGVQRATISEALAGLQDKKIIRYGYREVELRNVAAIEKLSCECFPAARAAIDDFLRDIKGHANST